MKELLAYKHIHIKNVSSREEAVQIDQEIAGIPSAERLLLDLHRGRGFREVGEDK